MREGVQSEGGRVREEKQSKEREENDENPQSFGPNEVLELPFKCYKSKYSSWYKYLKRIIPDHAQNSMFARWRG